jgi:hypothetical protein
VAPEVDEPASVTVEPKTGGSGLVVRGNGGCRFTNVENEITSIDLEEEIPQWHFPPNVEWLVRQIFAVYPKVTVNVATDRVDVTFYKKGLSGSHAVGVDRETAEHAADDLRGRLGNRSVCGIE